MATATANNYHLVRLLQLVSPSLPTGAFNYSQGLETAIEAGWISDASSLNDWLEDIMKGSLAHVDVPILMRFYQASVDKDLGRIEDLCNLLLACRESRELREEEINRGRAVVSLLKGLDLLPDPAWGAILARSQLAGFCLAAATWQITVEDVAQGYVWSWLENQVLAGVKIVPLGQTAGQRILLGLSDTITEVVREGLALTDDEIGASSPALALISCFHETQYTRIYRS